MSAIETTWMFFVDLIYALFSKVNDFAKLENAGTWLMSSVIFTCNNFWTIYNAGSIIAFLLPIPNCPKTVWNEGREKRAWLFFYTSFSAIPHWYRLKLCTVFLAFLTAVAYMHYQGWNHMFSLAFHCVCLVTNLTQAEAWNQIMFYSWMSCLERNTMTMTPRLYLVGKRTKNDQSRWFTICVFIELAWSSNTRSGFGQNILWKRNGSHCEAE